MIKQMIFGATLCSALAFLDLASSQLPAAAAADGEDAARATIIQAEKDWIAAVVSGKTDALERILADDVVAVDFQGHFIDKATMLAETKGAPKFFTSNVSDKVEVRFFGDAFAVSQGSETFEGQNGMPKKGQFVSTDTWVKRNGSWQIVANEVMLVAEPGK